MRHSIHGLPRCVNGLASRARPIRAWRRILSATGELPLAGPFDDDEDNWDNIESIINDNKIEMPA
jgi:hypothetical protein